MVAPYVASKGTASAVTTGAATPTYPASVAANDIIFLLVISHQPVSIGVIDTPTSFTEVAQGTYANSGSTNQGRAALFWRRASGSLTGTISVTRTGDTGVDGCFFAQMYRVVGAATSGDPWDAATTDYGPGNATVDIPSVTVSAAERTLLAFVAQADNAATVDPPAGYVGLVTDTTTTGTDAELRIFHRRNIDAGAATTAAGGETTGWASFHVSVKPAATYSAPSVAITGDAIRFDGAQDVMKLDPVDATGLIHTTMTCWCKLSVDTNSYQTVFAIEDGAGHSTAYNELITDADGTTLVVYDTAGLQGTVLSMTVGTWYALAIKFTAGAWKSYYGTQGFTSLTTATGTKTDIVYNDLTGVGSTTFTATESLNGMFSMYRVWSAALSDAEIKAELESSRPVRTNDMIGSWFPLGVASGTELAATLGNPLVSRGVGTPDWTFAAGPTLPVIGTGTTTQSNATSAGSGTVVGSVTGTGTSTQTDATSAATGLIVPVGTGASTQTDATSAGTGAVVTTVTGTGASTQGDATSSGTGAVGAAGTGASTQSDATSAGVGLMVPVGVGATTQSDATSAGAGTAEPPTVTGTGASTQGDATATGVGLVVPVGAGASTQGDATSAGAGDHGVAGTGATAQGDAVSAGVGLLVPVGVGASTQSDATSAGSGTAGEVTVTGTGASTQTDAVSAGVGLLVPVGSGASTQSDATSAGAGVHSITGAGTSAQGDATSAGTGAHGVAGAGASTQSDGASAGAGVYVYVGVGASTQSDATSSGTGLLVPVGVGASTQTDSVCSGSGTASASVVTGSGASSQSSSTSAGVGLAFGLQTPHYATPGASGGGTSVVQRPGRATTVQANATAIPTD